LVLFKVLFAAIKACLAAAAAAVVTGATAVFAIVTLVVVAAVGLGSLFGAGGSLAARRRKSGD
jgi:hypothetical protein